MTCLIEIFTYQLVFIVEIQRGLRLGQVFILPCNLPDLFELLDSILHWEEGVGSRIFLLDFGWCLLNLRNPTMAQDIRTLRDFLTRLQTEGRFRFAGLDVFFWKRAQGHSLSLA